MMKKLFFVFIFLTLIAPTFSHAAFELGPAVALQYGGPGIDALYKVPLLPLAFDVNAGMGLMAAAEGSVRYYFTPTPVVHFYTGAGYMYLRPLIAEAFATGIVRIFNRDADEVKIRLYGPTAKLGVDINFLKVALNLEGGVSYFPQLKESKITDNLLPNAMIGLRYRF